MPQVQCRYCGLPFKVRQVEAGKATYCCSGCALASRLSAPGPDGQFPVTAGLVAALGVAFGFFNEVLFWLLGLASANEHRAAAALIFLRLSAGLGVLVWIALAWAAGRSPARRASDAAVALATLAGVVLALLPPLSAGGIAAANTSLGLWLARGWGKRKFTRK